MKNILRLTYSAYKYFHCVFCALISRLYPLQQNISKDKNNFRILIRSVCSINIPAPFSRSLGPTLPSPRHAPRLLFASPSGPFLLLGGMEDKTLEGSVTNTDTVFELAALDGQWVESEALSPLPRTMSWFTAFVYEV